MLDPALISESCRLLNQARMIAEAPASQTSPIGTGHASSQFPPGLLLSKAGHLLRAQVSTLQACGERINRAIAHDSDLELAAANEWCASEMRALRHGRVVVQETPAEFDQRVVRDYEGVSAPDVARAERSYVARIRAARVRLGRVAKTGHRLNGSAPGGGSVDEGAGSTNPGARQSHPLSSQPPLTQ